MGNLIRTTLVFMGGMAAGGYCIINATIWALMIMVRNVVVRRLLFYRLGFLIIDDLYSFLCNSLFQSSSKRLRLKRCLVDCSDLIFLTRKDAEMVLSSMDDTIKQYGIVSLADVYDLAGQANPSYVANKFGWRSVSDGKVIRKRDGYCIDPPNAEGIR